MMWLHTPLQLSFNDTWYDSPFGVYDANTVSYPGDMVRYGIIDRHEPLYWELLNFNPIMTIGAVVLTAYLVQVLLKILQTSSYWKTKVLRALFFTAALQMMPIARSPERIGTSFPEYVEMSSSRFPEHVFPALSMSAAGTKLERLDDFETILGSSNPDSLEIVWPLADLNIFSTPDSMELVRPGDDPGIFPTTDLLEVVGLICSSSKLFPPVTTFTRRNLKMNPCFFQTMVDKVCTGFSVHMLKPVKPVCSGLANPMCGARAVVIPACSHSPNIVCGASYPMCGNECNGLMKIYDIEWQRSDYLALHHPCWTKTDNCSYDGDILLDTSKITPRYDLLTSTNYGMPGFEMYNGGLALYPADPRSMTI